MISGDAFVSNGPLREPPIWAVPDALSKVFTLALSTGGAWAEIFHECRVDGMATYAAQDQCVQYSSLAEGVALRVIGETGSCQVFAPVIQLEGLADLARQAADMFRTVRCGGRLSLGGPPARLAQPRDEELGEVYDPAELDRNASAALTAARDAPEIDAARVRLATWGRRLTIATSAGSRTVSVDRGTRLTVDSFAARGADRSKGRAGWSRALGHDQLTSTDIELVARRASAQAQRLLGTDPVAETELPVVFAPPAAGLLVHELFGHSCEADALAAGTSLLASALGQQVTDSSVSLSDGFGGPGVWGGYRTDDEGQANTETELVVDGTFVGVVTDRGGASKWVPTGNGRRQSYQHPVLPRLSTTRLTAGSTSPESMVQGLRNGLLVLAAEGGAINAKTGLLTITVKEGRVIREGEKGPVVSGMTLVRAANSVFRLIRAVGDDPEIVPMLCGKHGQWIPVAAQSPSILVEHMRVIGA